MNGKTITESHQRTDTILIKYCYRHWVHFTTFAVKEELMKDAEDIEKIFIPNRTLPSDVPEWIVAFIMTK